MRFAELLDLAPEGSALVGRSPAYAHGVVYGGQLLAQALRAASSTVGPGHLPRSLVVHFLRPGRPQEPVAFTTDTLAERRARGVHRVEARQGEQLLAVATACFDDGVDVPSPADTDTDTGTGAGAAFASWRDVEGTHRVDVGPSSAWLRLPSPLPSPVERACGIAYLSDNLPADAVAGPAVTAAHSICFHHLADPSDWQLHHVECHESDGRFALVTGTVADARGARVATFTQELVVGRRRQE